MKHSLLFIDDSPDDVELARWHLAKAGIECEPRQVTTGESLRDALSLDLPELIVCDIVLPGFDGWDALRVCQQVAPAVPFILYSGTVSRHNARLAQERGVFAAVEKDATAEFVGAVRLALRL